MTDWGRIGGEYSDGTLANCHARAAAYAANNSIVDDTEGNACGGLQQLATAKLMNAVCGRRGCKFVLNTADNFYIHGCYADGSNYPAYLQCAARFKNDWENVYNIPAMEHINGLPWISSLGNHDILGMKAGVDTQIAYQQKNPNWILPSRWYTADVKATSGPSVRFHVAHTSCWVGKYRKAGSSYNTDEVQECSTPQAVAQQLSFLNDSLASSTADYNVILGHHPGLSSAGPSYFQIDEFTPTADGWGGLAKLVQKYNPVAYFNGTSEAVLEKRMFCCVSQPPFCFTMADLLLSLSLSLHLCIINACIILSYLNLFSFTGHDHVQSIMYTASPVVSMDANVTSGYPYTTFYTSGAGSWAQPQDGGFGLPMPYAFTKYVNTDLTRGIGYGGFAIVTVTKRAFVVDFYSQPSMTNWAYRVYTRRGGVPRFIPSPFLMQNDVLMNASNPTSVYSVGFRKLLNQQ